MKPTVRPSGTAPHMARSFTVPQTARRPMSPPGKNRGLTMCASVVRASREPPAGNGSRQPSRPASSPASSVGLPSRGRNSRSISSAVSRPPPPWPSTMRSWCGRGSGQVRAGRIEVIAQDVAHGIAALTRPYR